MTTRSAKIVAVMNMKGGVGKSSTVVGLADFVAASGRSVLVVDVDTQATASYCILGNDRLTELIRKQQTIDEYLLNALVRGRVQPLVSVIAKHASATTQDGVALPISLVPSSSQTRVSERQILLELTRRGQPLAQIEQSIRDRLVQELALVGHQYSLVLVDCAPGVSPFTSAVIGMADMLIIPTVPDTPSVLGLEAFLGNIVTEMVHPRGPRVPPRVLLTRFAPKTFLGWFGGTGGRRRIRHHAELAEEIEVLARASERTPYHFGVMRTKVRETHLMPHAMSLGSSAPTMQQKYPRSSLREDLESLSRELLEILGIPLEPT